MKDRWKSNIGLKIGAVFFAIILWWTVVNLDDPIGTRTFNTEVMILNPEVITNEGRSFQVVEETQSVSVTVEARRKILERIKASSIEATADMRELQGTSVPVRIKIKGYEGQYESALAKPVNIQVDIEATQSKEFVITPVATGTVREGYVLGNTSVSPQTVKITGPQSTINKISKVVARVDVAELSKDTSIDTHLVYLDAADNVIDKTMLTSDCDKNGVTVLVELWRTKNVPLEFNTSAIVPGAGYLFDSIQIEPQTITIAGAEEELSGFTKLAIGANALKRYGICENEKIILDITEYLPEGIKLADETQSNVVVNIILEEIGTKVITVPVRSVKVENALENLQIEYGPEQEVELKFEGDQEMLDALTSEKIIVAIDLSLYSEEGTYNVPVKVTEYPEGCIYVGEATIQIVLTEK